MFQLLRLAVQLNTPFLEAIRQIKNDIGKSIACIYTSLVPSDAAGELKSKPTQHSVKELRSIGIQPT